LLILTTNRERELPQAFLRRCVVLELEPPTREWFVEVAQRKLGNETGDLYKLVADRIMELRKAAELGGHRLPGTGEFLDAIQAWRQLKIEGNSKPFKYITLAAAWKQPKAPPEQASS
jgi:MoxR-like ATPase